VDKRPCSFEGWIFAARHGLLGLEKYQRDNVENRNLILYILKEEDGLKLMLDQGVSVEAMSLVMASVFGKKWIDQYTGYACCRCRRSLGSISPCYECRQKLLKNMRIGFRI